MTEVDMAGVTKAEGIEEKEIKHSSFDSKFPVLLPYSDKLFCSDSEFATFLSTITSSENSGSATNSAPKTETTTPADKKYEDTEAEPEAKDTMANPTAKAEQAPLMNALLNDDAMNHDNYTLAFENKMLTHNADVAFVSTKSPLVDLFFDLAEGFNAESVKRTLAKAWKEDPLATLKIVFNARSIHLGKASRPAAYNALGWLYEHHPQTFLANLVWLVRPVIEKKAPKKEDKKDEVVKDEAKPDEDEDFEMIDEPAIETGDVPAGSNTMLHDVKYGVAHGYWKDLLNM
jgi:hypothetical protein